MHIIGIRNWEPWIVLGWAVTPRNPDVPMWWYCTTSNGATLNVMTPFCEMVPHHRRDGTTSPESLETLKKMTPSSDRRRDKHRSKRSVLWQSNWNDGRRQSKDVVIGLMDTVNCFRPASRPRKMGVSCPSSCHGGWCGGVVVVMVASRKCIIPNVHTLTTSEQWGVDRKPASHVPFFTVFFRVPGHFGTCVFVLFRYCFSELLPGWLNCDTLGH